MYGHRTNTSIYSTLTLARCTFPSLVFSHFLTLPLALVFFSLATYTSDKEKGRGGGRSVRNETERTQHQREEQDDSCLKERSAPRFSFNLLLILNYAQNAAKHVVLYVCACARARVCACVCSKPEPDNEALPPR